MTIRPFQLRSAAARSYALELERSRRTTPATPQLAPTVPVTLNDLIAAYANKGLVGEENTAVLQTLAAVGGMSFGIEGKSGSGKTQLVEILTQLLPTGTVYRLELTSKTAPFYNTQDINAARILYIPELQKALRSHNDIIEIVKNISEGRDSIRHVRIGKQNIEQRITAGKSIVYTLADENDFKKDIELGRRFLQLYADPGENLTQQILQKKTRKRTQPFSSKNSMQAVPLIQNHLRHTLNHRAPVINPFAEAMVPYLPREELAMRSHIDHYLGLIEGSVLFHQDQRQTITHDRMSYALADLTDVRLVHQHYIPHLLETLRRRGTPAGALPEPDWSNILHQGIEQIAQTFPRLAEARAQNQAS